MMHSQEDLIDCLSDDSDELAGVDLLMSKTMQQKQVVVGQKPRQRQTHLGMSDSIF